MVITKGLKKKAIAIAEKYDTRVSPVLFIYRGACYAVQQVENRYLIYDDADGGKALDFVILGEFTA